MVWDGKKVVSSKTCNKIPCSLSLRVQFKIPLFIFEYPPPTVTKHSKQNWNLNNGALYCIPRSRSKQKRVHRSVWLTVIRRSFFPCHAASFLFPPNKMFFYTNKMFFFKQKQNVFLFNETHTFSLLIMSIIQDGL